MVAAHQPLMAPYIKHKTSMFLNRSSSDAENSTTRGGKKENSFKHIIDMDIIFPLLRWKHLRVIEQMENQNEKHLFLERAKFLIHFGTVICST